MENSSRTLNGTESADGTRIVCEQRGEGPALVLVGGALCTAASDASLTELLAERFTVFTYDRRGRGSSGDTAPYAVEREVEDLTAVIAQAGGSALVHGMPSGAALALRAASDGLPITMLSVYEPPFETDPGLREAGRGYEPGCAPCRPRAARAMRWRSSWAPWGCRPRRCRACGSCRSGRTWRRWRTRSRTTTRCWGTAAFRRR
ncbi:alpha/beta fold hydrolase [Streptomyces sp. V4I23]|uniref:alpha/beta fold hydrolase n=1 Tax=Streptomyces sp. V4I23 TaxID=3042282 RepID=UPI00358F2503